MTITAHSGCMGTPENSMESIIAGFENGADICEIDIRVPDGCGPILSHDDPKKPEACAKLEDAFAYLASRETGMYNLDVKDTRNLEQVQALAERYGVLDRVFFTGVWPHFVRDVRAKCPKIPYYLNFNMPPAWPRSKAFCRMSRGLIEHYGAVGLNTNKANLTQMLVEVFHRRGLPVSVWTARKEEDLLKCAACGVDNITTTRPDLRGLVDAQASAADE